MSGDIIKRVIEILAEIQPTMSESVAVMLETQIRYEFAGERVYIHKRDESIGMLIAQRFNGNNTQKLAHELRVSRSTVYRAIRKRRVAAR